MICSMLDSVIGVRKLFGKMLTTTSMGFVASGASYVRLLVSSAGKVPLNKLARIRPITVAIAVVQK